MKYFMLSVLRVTLENAKKLGQRAAMASFDQLQSHVSLSNASARETSESISRVRCISIFR
jgi:hypothetical protein